MSTYLDKIYSELGVTETHLRLQRLNPYKEPPLDTLEIVEIDFEGKPFILESGAADAWRKMHHQAKKDGISIEPFSGFRSYLYQKQLIKRKLEKGKSLETILTETAIPGFSEHHTGCAVDICTDGKYFLDESFENTNAFSWLMKNAENFNFSLSYPRNNDKGIIFEPWHWFFAE